MLIGKERHDIGRPHDWGYPIRGIVTAAHLYLKNHEPTRWPAGNPETGYLDTDGSPTKTEILTANRAKPIMVVENRRIAGSVEEFSSAVYGPSLVSAARGCSICRGSNRDCRCPGWRV